MLKVDPLEPLMMAGLHQLGCNVSWIAKLVGSGRDRIYRQLRTLIDLAPAEKTGRPQKKSVSKEDDRMIADLYGVGISPIDIAHTLALDLPLVLKVLSEKQQKQRSCLRCGDLSPNWICQKCKRLKAKGSAGFDEVYG